MACDNEFYINRKGQTRREAGAENYGSCKVSLVEFFCPALQGCKMAGLPVRYPAVFLDHS